MAEVPVVTAVVRSLSRILTLRWSPFPLGVRPPLRRVAPIPISPSTLASPGAQTVSRAHPAQQARLARKAPKAPEARLDSLDSKAQRVSKALSAPQELPARLARRESRVKKETGGIHF